MITHQFGKMFSKKKDYIHDVYFSDMKAKDFVSTLSNPGYGVYIKRNEKDSFICKELSSLIQETCEEKDETKKTVSLCFIWMMIKATEIKPFYTSSNTDSSKKYINGKIDDWLKEIYPIIKNVKLGENEKNMHKEIFHILQISEEVLPKKLVHTYQKVISDKLIKLESKK